MKRLAFLLTVGILASLQPAQSQQNLTKMTGVHGMAGQLVVAGTPVPGPGKGTMAISVYSDGRMGLYFFPSDAEAVTFSGSNKDGLRAGDGQIKLDRVVVKLGADAKAAPKTVPVSGACHYDDFYSGPSSVKCMAKADDGSEYSANFLTDGLPPE